jgi:hypothetical protein
MNPKVKKGEPRPKGICTSCGKPLPESTRGWGLNWHDGSGMCAKCLYLIRKAIGYFERLEKKKARLNSEQ